MQCSQYLVYLDTTSLSLLLTSFIYFNLNFWPPAAACSPFVPQPGDKPATLALEGRVNHWTTGEMLMQSLLIKTPHIYEPLRFIDTFLGTSMSYLMRHGYLKKKEKKTEDCCRGCAGLHHFFYSIILYFKLLLPCVYGFKIQSITSE